ncbi:MAG: efflux RND transporter periplasmic adaptor subunit [Deltaproteobacteria bacterium]
MPSLKIIILVLMLALSGCTPNSNSKVNESVESVVPVHKGNLEGKLTWRGVVRSASRLEIRADKKVKIGKVHVHNFDAIKKGQLLIEVDRSETLKRKRELQEAFKNQELDFESMKLKYAQGAKNFNRKKTLAEKGILAMKELEEAQRDYKVLENELKAKELEIQKALREISQSDVELKAANFYAPTDGVVTGVWDIATGNVEVNAGQALVTIIDPQSFALWVQVEETNLAMVSLGKKAQVTLDTLPGKVLQGSIFEISSNAVDTNSRVKMYNMGIAFQGKDLELKEGYAGEGSLIYANKPNALTVPLGALKYLDGKDFLVVANTLSGSRKTVPIQVGIKTDTEAEIVSGVSETDSVVVSD